VALIMERSFKAEIDKLLLGNGEVFNGEAIVTRLNVKKDRSNDAG
jgi:hypothetical protein